MGLKFRKQAFLNIKGDITEDQIGKLTRYKILQAQKWRCAICGQKINFSKHHLKGDGGEVAHIDHIHPKSKKNSYEGEFIGEIKNLQALCQTCNLKKHDNKFAHLDLEFWKNR